MVFLQRSLKAQKKPPFERAAKPGEDCLRASNIVFLLCREGAPCEGKSRGSLSVSWRALTLLGITRHGLRRDTLFGKEGFLGGPGRWFPDIARESHKTIDIFAKI